MDIKIKNKIIPPSKPLSPKNPLPPKQSCLGPVADLEKYLPADWWRSLFNSLYLKTDADVVEKSENTLREVALILGHTRVKPEDRILDLCCGQGRHALALAEKGYKNVVGIDRSRYLIRLARKRAADKGFSCLQFREGDARKIRIADNSFDLITVMGNSFGYFEREEENLAVLKEISRLLRSGGTFFLDVTDGEWMKQNFSPRSWEWIDQNMLVCRERTLAQDSSRLINREIVVDANKGVITDQFYADRLYNAQELTAFLQKAGFDSISLSGNLQAESDRAAPDLGMMANRIILTAKAKPKRVSKPRVPQTKIQCMVILGDPGQPDTVKLGGKFNPEDHETVRRMKDTLARIEDYHFYYLDDHKKLIDNLIHHRPSFVFNLCDEGFQNDAFKELHVPALLEMLQIPYTGAGPVCLGMCYNKGLVAAWAKELGIETPEEIWIEAANSSTALPTEFPAFVKPVFGDSSIGITKEALIHNATQLIDYCDWMRSTLPGTPILVQEYLPGKEYSVGLIGNQENFHYLPVLEVDFNELPEGLPHILGYESKWVPDSPYFTKINYVQANLPEEQLRELYDASALLFQRLGCRDYARFDFRKDKNGKIKLLEVNPNPGWCWDGKMNKMAGFAGWDYLEMLEHILQAARERIGII